MYVYTSTSHTPPILGVVFLQDGLIVLCAVTLSPWPYFSTPLLSGLYLTDHEAVIVLKQFDFAKAGVSYLSRGQW